MKPGEDFYNIHMKRWIFMYVDGWLITLKKKKSLNPKIV